MGICSIDTLAKDLGKLPDVRDRPIARRIRTEVVDQLSDAWPGPATPTDARRAAFTVRTPLAAASLAAPGVICRWLWTTLYQWRAYWLLTSHAAIHDGVFTLPLLTARH